MLIGNCIFYGLPCIPVPKESQIELAKNYLRDVRVNHYHFFTLVTVPFKRFVSSSCYWQDNPYFEIPQVSWQARQAVIELRNPIKTTSK